LMLVVRFARLAPGREHNRLLGQTAQLQLFFSCLLLLGCLFSPLR